MADSHYELYEDNRGEHRWRLKANGRIVSDSGEGYATRAAGQQAIQRHRSRAATTDIREVAKKAPAKKAPAKKGPAKKGPAKKAPAKKGPAKKGPAKKGPAKKGPAKKALAKKAPAKKAAARKTPARKR